MPERSALTQGVQVGVEATPGTSVAANKLLNSIGIEPSVSVDMNRFRPMGQKFASVIVPGKEWVEADIEGVGTYTELMYLFNSCLVAATPAQIAATTAYRSTFAPAARAEDTVKTLTVEAGGAIRAHKFTYGLVTELELEFTREGIGVSGSMIGQRLSDGITLTATPTAIEEMPILPIDIDVFLDATSGGLGGTKLLRVLSATWTMGDRFNPVWVLNSANTSFVAHVEQEPTAQVTLMVEADAAGMGLLSTMRAGSTQFLRIKATSANTAGVGNPYSLTLDQAVKVSDVGDFSDEDGVYAIEYTFDVVYDATWAKALQVELVNKQTAL
jgi:hypothetical protein